MMNQDRTSKCGSDEARGGTWPGEAEQPEVPLAGCAPADRGHVPGRWWCGIQDAVPWLERFSDFKSLLKTCIRCRALRQ